MEIKPIAKQLAILLLITLLLVSLENISQMALFTYLGVVTGTLLGLTLYWFGLCLIAYWLEQDKPKQVLLQDRSNAKQIYVLLIEATPSDSPTNGKYSKHLDGRDC